MTYQQLDLRLVPHPFETPVPGPIQDALLLGMNPEDIAVYARRTLDSECYHRDTPERFIPHRPETYWGVCMTFGVVADPGHHFARNPDASTD